jgi:hypothetical protein
MVGSTYDTQVFRSFDDGDEIIITDSRGISSSIVPVFASRRGIVVGDPSHQYFRFYGSTWSIPSLDLLVTPPRDFFGTGTGQYPKEI